MGQEAKQEINIRPMSKAEAYEEANKRQLENFLDRNGYTAREVRGIARRAISLWESQKPR